MNLPDDGPQVEGSGLLAEAKAGDNAPALSVTELSLSLKRTIETSFGRVRLRGEISGFKRHASGHCYFTLKDENACIDAVIWRSGAAALEFRPEDGAEVIATGKLTTYPGRSKYQIVVDRLELASEGALLALLERRRKALAAEGLEGPFDGLLAAYLVRNLPDRDAGVGVLVDHLAPGAPIAVHEYSVADSAYARGVWSAVCWAVIIPLGWRVTGDASLYRYLWRSVLAFDGLGRLEQRLRDAGLREVHTRPVDGWQRGIVHTVLGCR